MAQRVSLLRPSGSQGSFQDSFYTAMCNPLCGVSRFAISKSKKRANRAAPGLTLSFAFVTVWGKRLQDVSAILKPSAPEEAAFKQKEHFDGSLEV